MRVRLRLLPAVIFCAAFALTVKLGAIWQNFDGVLVPTQAAAEEKPATPAAKAPSGKPSAGQAANGATDGSQEAARKGGTKEDAAAKDSGGERTKKARGWFDPSQVTDSELEVLQKLADRRTELDHRQQEIDARARLLQATEKRIDSKIAELKGIQQTVDSLLKQHDKQKDEQLRSVVKIYENMKPKDAARIFEQLDMTVLLDVIERMREQKAAPVLANMSPDKAKAVTALLAERRALPKPQAIAGQ
jgi:flagellar motility protein MotE (MotC chaperone)